MSYLLGKFIDDQGLKNIKEHKYVSGEFCPLEKFVDHFWNFVVKFLPRWMAPNLVTLLGIVFVMVTYSLMLFYDPSMTQKLPEWTYIAAALGVFAYQTLDGIDGKHSRRIGASSPLGQLFDHGVDSLCLFLCAMTLVSSLQLGLSLQAVLVVFAFSGRFFFTNFLEHFTGIYIYSVGIFSSILGEYIIITLNLLPGIFGNHFYETKASQYFSFLPSTMTEGFLMKDYAVMLVFVFGLCYISAIVFKIFTNIKGFALLLTVMVQSSQHMLCYYLMFCFNSQIPFVRKFGVLAYLTVAMMYSMMTIKLIISTISKMKFGLLHFEFLIFLPFFYIQSQYDGSLESEEKIKGAFLTTFMTMLALYGKFVHCLISQLTEYLNIPMFRVPKKTLAAKVVS